MDFRKLSVFIIILSIAVLVYGGVKYATNLPVKFDQSKSERTIFGGRNDLGNLLNVYSENSSREIKRESATKVMIAGAIVLFIGIGISASARKKESQF